MKNWPDIVRDFGVAYFFLMWFVSQFARVAKQLDDRAQLERIETSIGAIHASLADRGETHEPESSARRVNAIAEPVSRQLLVEARHALEAGLYTSAMITSAVAFEHALRTQALRIGVERAESLPVPRLVEHLAEQYGPDVAGDLRGLWKLRNTLVHLREDQAPDLQVAQNVFNSFAWAVDLLTRPGA